MLLPISWLKELVNIDDDINGLAAKLTDHSCEIEDKIDQKKQLDKVVVGKITKIEKHPDADKLVVCQVETGTTNIQIVTGAPNVFEGAIIPVAIEGADLPNGVLIKSSKLRGIKSEGMMCSEMELGLSDSAQGIMILENKPAIGTDVSEYLEMTEQVLDITITPNRGDLLSMQGLAREIAAIYDKKTKKIDISYKDNSKHESKLKVINEAPELCERYMGVVIKGIKIAPSPEWMQKKLRSVDIKPINNIVDITNYVLYECGQPLHAFSYEKITAATIVVRTAKEGETLEALNDQEIKLSDTNLIIADNAGPLAIAGVIGGKNSAVHDDTADIVLEAASFDPISVRRTSFLKGIRTEASQRFEKGVDFYNTEFAFHRAIKLILDICGGTISSNICDVYEAEPKPVTIELRPERVNSLLGTNIDKKEMINILERLEFTADKDIITVPSFRAAEVTREADLIEEIGRIFGFNNIESVLPPIRNFNRLELNLSNYDISKSIRDFMTQKGLSETVSYSMVSPNELPITFNKEAIKMKNPLTSSESVLRTNLFISLIKTQDYNSRHLVEGYNIFEIGNAYYLNGETVVQELQAAALFAASPITPVTVKEKKTYSFPELKGVVEELLLFLNLKQVNYSRNDIYEFLHPGKSAKVTIGKDTLAVFGEVHPSINEHYGFKTKMYYMEIRPVSIKKYASIKRKYKKFSLYPTMKRDTSFWIDKNVDFDSILKVINKSKAKNLKNVNLIDIYDGKKHGDDKINMTIQLVFQGQDKTLEEDEVNLEFQTIVNNITNKLDIIFA